MGRATRSTKKRTQSPAREEKESGTQGPGATEATPKKKKKTTRGTNKDGSDDLDHLAAVMGQQMMASLREAKRRRLEGPEASGPLSDGAEGGVSTGPTDLATSLDDSKLYFPELGLSGEMPGNTPVALVDSTASSSQGTFVDAGIERRRALPPERSLTAQRRHEKRARQKEVCDVWGFSRLKKARFFLDEVAVQPRASHPLEMLLLA
jgi:hypothetical protein